MAIKLQFDKEYNIISPTVVLLARNGRRLGAIPTSPVKVKNYLNSACELQFNVYLASMKNNRSLWDKIVDFKLIWVKEWNMSFEITVETSDEDGIKKIITATALGETELSQINLYGIEINTEDDIAREDYVPTVLYNGINTRASLLHRILAKAPHYTIAHVDSTISNIQRSFSFDSKSIYDCMQDIATEIDCLFVIECCFDAQWNFIRKISVYDLESYCPSCGKRGLFIKTCSECGNTVGIVKGYGNDTGIFLNTENIAENIKYSTDTGSVKNCFKLEAGDDLMTATVLNSNPNGSGYLWYISDETKQDMSSSLVQKLDDYDTQYQYYKSEYEANITASQVVAYNELITKYSTQNPDLTSITIPIVGYSGVMEAEYDTIDLYLYLNNNMMPTVVVASTDAATEAAKLTNENLSPVSVQNISTASSSTVESTVLSAAKTIVDSRYKIEISTTSYSNETWIGTFTLTNYSDETDTATTNSVTIAINDDYENFVQQKIDRMISKTVANGEPTDIVSLFNLSGTDFENELKKYCLTRLKNFYECCQSCIDILTQQGVADKTLWANAASDLYTSLYTPYYQKLEAITEEINVRESELEVIAGSYDSDGNIQTDGLQTELEKERKKIQTELNMESYLGTTLWSELASYRRDDTYKNDNYISDGLDNAQLFKRAKDFLEIAQKEIIKSATMQHSITATLKNLLAIKEFSPIWNQFEVGNWLRVKIDGVIYKLRLVDFEVDLDSIDQLNVTFSDILAANDCISDIEKILSQARSMSTSYGTVSRQAEEATKTTGVVNNWKENGLDVTNTKIVCAAENQSYTSDEHGMTFKKYDPVLDTYDNCQLKITNSTIAITDDNWESIKTAVGYYYYFDPVTGKLMSTYGVNGETIIGRLILGEYLGIYNESGNMTFNDNGFIVSNNINTFTVNPNSNTLLNITKTVDNVTTSLLSLDSNGQLHIVGDGSALDITANDSVTGMNTRITQNSDNISIIANKNSSGTVVSLNSEKVRIAWNSLSQYIQFETINNKAGLSIYNDSVQPKLLMRLDNTGLETYSNNTNNSKLMDLNSYGITYFDNNNNKIGMIGTGQWGSTDMRGIVFRLNHIDDGYDSSTETYNPSDGRYMSWGYQESSGGSYIVKLAYLANTYGGNSKGFHFYEAVHMDSTFYINDYIWLAKYAGGDGGIRSLTNKVSIVGSESRLVAVDSNGSELHSFKVSSNGVDCYGNLDMHNNTILNSSDIRMKTNIADTEVNALELLNKISLRSFDWIESEKHENIGIIAQQLQEVIPELVEEDAGTTKLSIAQVKFIPYLIKAIQELYELINGKTKSRGTDNNVKDYNIKEKRKFLKDIKDDNVMVEVEPDSPIIIRDIDDTKE